MSDIVHKSTLCSHYKGVRGPRHRTLLYKLGVIVKVLQENLAIDGHVLSRML